MQIKTLLTRTLVIISLLLVGAFLLGTMFYVTISGPLESDLVVPVEILNISAEQEEVVQPVVGLPVRLRIPEINVNTLVESVGVTPAGAMGIPDGPINVAWFKFGSRPGEVGSAVIAGHTGWKNDIPAVFDNLHKIEIGSKIYTEDDKGVISTFVVRDIRKYSPKADASDVFISEDGKAHINLITCEGPWDAVSRSSSQRLVVFADKE